MLLPVSVRCNSHDQRGRKGSKGGGEEEERDMEGSDYSDAADVTNVPHEYYPSSTPTSNHTLGFPLGTALLLVVIFSLSFAFSCFYHWDKVQAFRRRLRQDVGGGGDHENDPRHGMPLSPSKPNISLQRDQQSLPAIIMPGNRIPTFIAWPCPCESLPPPLSSPPVKIVMVDMHIVEAPLLPPPPPPRGGGRGP